jgi:hypothetical protein
MRIGFSPLQSGLDLLVPDLLSRVSVCHRPDELLFAPLRSEPVAAGPISASGRSILLPAEVGIHRLGGPLLGQIHNSCESEAGGRDPHVVEGRAVAERTIVLDPPHEPAVADDGLRLDEALPHLDHVLVGLLGALLKMAVDLRDLDLKRIKTLCLVLDPRRDRTRGRGRV